MQPTAKANYQIVNEQEAKAFWKPSECFIYVLMLNPGIELEQVPKPFYIGQTKNPKKRFQNHAQIEWHIGTFWNPLKVFIAGSVPYSMANGAEESLIHYALEAGYELTNSGHNRAGNLGWEFDSALEYFNKPFRGEDYLRQWREKYPLANIETTKIPDRISRFIF